jgi:hypothetical protein
VPGHRGLVAVAIKLLVFHLHGNLPHVGGSHDKRCRAEAKDTSSGTIRKREETWAHLCLSRQMKSLAVQMGQTEIRE